MRHLRVILLLFLIGIAPAYAGSSAGTEHVQVKLVADKDAVAPGDTLTVAVVEDIIPEWHTYWLNPGDSGIAPTLSWTLPPDFVAGPILWPPPQNLPYGPLVNFGYGNHVVLLSEIKVPPDATAGTTQKLAATFTWLVCQETCIPENAKLDISVRIAATSRIAENDADLFTKARAELPKPAPFKAELTTDAKVLTLTIAAPEPSEAFFYPFKSGLIDDSSPQLLQTQGDGFTLQLVRGELRQPLSALDGVLELTNAAGTMTAYTLTAALPAPPTPVSMESGVGLLAALGLGLIGGIILNLMPCVFPVLSLKVLALARHAHGDHADAKTSGIAYTAGILVAFAVIAALLLGLRAAGSAVGWGFQLQSPIFVLCLAYLLFAMGLSLSGFFTLSGKFVNLGGGLTSSEGIRGSFFTGALAALVATPCSAPFMGTAVGFALTQSWPLALAIIEMLGLGLALPYLVLAFNPSLIRHMPKPGAWMERLKQFLAFPLYGSSVWLLWVLSLQAGPGGVLVALGGAVLLSFALWSYNLSRHVRHKRPRQLCIALAILSVLATVGSIASPRLWRDQSQSGPANSFVPAGWESFSQAQLQQLQKDGTPVFVDMSAAWCITCILNEKVALGPEMVAAMHQKGIVLLKGDWTNQDPQITALLASFGRSGVPLYVYYPVAQKPPVVLPQILSRGIVMDAIGP